jgi:hypothetical protein
MATWESIIEKAQALGPGADYPGAVHRQMMLDLIEKIQSIETAVEPVPVEVPLIESGPLDAQLVSSDNDLAIDIQQAHYFLFETYLVVNFRIQVPTSAVVSSDEFVLSMLKVTDTDPAIIRDGYFITRDTFFQIMNEEIDHIQASVRNVSGEPFQIRITVNNPSEVSTIMQIQAVLILEPIIEE